MLLAYIMLPQRTSKVNPKEKEPAALDAPRVSTPRYRFHNKCIMMSHKCQSGIEPARVCTANANLAIKDRRGRRSLQKRREQAPALQ